MRGASVSRFGLLGRQIAQLLRVALPLGALALLSTVFLVPRGIDPQLAVDVSQIDVEDLARDPRVGGARFAGMTRDGTAVTISAQTVRSTEDLQDNGPIHLLLDAPDGELQFSSGRKAVFRGQEGRIDQAQDEITVQGSVMLETSDGYRVNMAELISAIETTHVQGFGGITGHGPAGDITADSLELTQTDAQSGGYLLAFKGNVRLIYFPDD